MKQNLLIIGPVAAGKRTLLNKLKNKYKLNVLDTGKLFRFLAMCIHQETDINPNYNLLFKNDKSEIERITNKIHRRNKTLSELLSKVKVNDGNIFFWTRDKRWGII